MNGEPVWDKRCAACDAPIPEGHFIGRVVVDNGPGVYTSSDLFCSWAHLEQFAADQHARAAAAEKAAR